MTNETEPSVATEPDAPSRKWVILGLAVALITAAPWLYSIVTHTTVKPADYLQDRTFPTRAQPICERAMTELKTYPPAKDATDPVERANTIDATTAILDDMIAQLRAAVPPTEDAKYINIWLDHWGIHVSDRRDFASRLRRPDGSREEFFETPIGGRQVSKSVTGYADANEMPACSVPQDV